MRNRTVLVGVLAVSTMLTAGAYWGGVARADDPGALPAGMGQSPGRAANGDDLGFEEVFPKEYPAIVEALGKRDLDAALKLTDALVEANGGSADALLLKAEVLNRKGDKEEARKQLERALEIAPGHPMGNAMMALFMAKSGDVKGAVARLQKATETNPGSAIMTSVLADMQGQAKDVAGMIKTLETGAAKVKSGESRFVLYGKLAQAYLTNDQPEEAVKAADQALKLKPGSVEAAVIKATALEAKGDIEGAYDAFVAVKSKPGSLKANAKLMGQLDQKIAALKPEAMKQKAERAAAAKAEQDKKELARIEKARGRAVSVMEAYQKSPGDAKAREAAEALMLEACLAMGSRPTSQLIPVHATEVAQSKERKPAGVAEARKKLLAVTNKDTSVTEAFNAGDPRKALAILAGQTAIYPKPDLLRLMAEASFMLKDYQACQKYAALAAGMESLEFYQHPIEEEYAVLFGGGEMAFAEHVELVTQAKRFETGELSEGDKLLSRYIGAAEKKDWVKLFELYQEGRVAKVWADPTNPMAVRYGTLNTLRVGEIEPAVVFHGKRLISDGDKDGLAAWVKLMRNGYFSKEPTYEFYMAAYDTLGMKDEYEKMQAKTLDVYPFNPMVRLAMGKGLEKEGKTGEAMYQYNAGAKGLATSGFTGVALECAQARDRIEAKQENRTKKYAEFIDAERAVKNLSRPRHAVVVAALERMLPETKDKGLIHLIKGIEEYAVGMHDECLADMNKALALKTSNEHLAYMYIGDAWNQKAQKVDYDLREKDGARVRTDYLKKSVAAYDVAIEKAKEKASLASLYYARGIRYRDLEEDDRAISDLDRATELFGEKVKNRAWAYYEVSKLKQKKEDMAGAKVYAQKALDAAMVIWDDEDDRPGEFGARVEWLKIRS